MNVSSGLERAERNGRTGVDASADDDDDGGDDECGYEVTRQLMDDGQEVAVQWQVLTLLCDGALATRHARPDQDDGNSGRW